MGIKKLLKKLALPLTPLNKIIPKNKRLILIYSNLGFRDNARSIYDFMTGVGYNKKYKIVVGCNDWKTWKKDAPDNVKFVRPRRALRTYLRCSYMLYTYGKFPVKPTKKQTVVNLWHGMPLKTVGALEKGADFDGKCYFNYIIATSPFFSKVMQRCFAVGEDKVILTGQPRCDKLFDVDVHKKKLILWLPTYRSSHLLGSVNAEIRNETGLPLIDREEHLHILDALLKDLGYKLLIKPHPLQELPSGMKSLENVMVTSQRGLERKDMDIYDLMKRSTALITDYSSVYFDYLLLDRPIGFTLGDMERYDQERGFVTEDPLSLMPGEKLCSFDQLMIFIRACACGEDSFKEERARVSELVNSHQTGGACKQILDIIGVEM
ncbi:MAG: CDP-glycerol glycerophosphotransferase family protein [Ruminococcus sp.]|nr:CDP-glycerol glycerophosphotransferase family protein [Ruminococcus sp.]